MTNETAIELLESYDFPEGSPQLTQAAYMGAAALRDEVEAGLPLTPEELREMVGQWVWVVVQYEHCECTGWAFIPTPAYIAYLDQTISTDLCGKKFKAYRRKPEEGAP